MTLEVTVRRAVPEDSKCIRGLIQWSFMGHSYYIEDLYVQPSSRRTGVGLKIFKEIAKDAIENNAKKLFFSVLNWNEPAINFYKKLGALDYTADMTLDIYRFTRPAMETLVNAE
ncbi:unnamed protein product [Notodromas monacha]|uniref:N-acetyltransferase domain-containing protein n=1 Tax=Notodromas monacha TaxID=399045 RepID=A0A7R9BII7_9CRUS|nr:unnamed protein product [Notodromas monacha]CAG0915048.1 unnamed protein product [Notodromas monacha]